MIIIKILGSSSGYKHLPSWNSKFVDFVKRKELIGSYEEINDKKTKRHNEPGEFSKKFNERTQDESWAENFEL